MADILLHPPHFAILAFFFFDGKERSSVVPETTHMPVSHGVQYFQFTHTAYFVSGCEST
jgi:hypothetical protein